MSARILIIDDEPRWANFVRDDLSRYDTAFATDAKTALTQLDTNPFDLIIASSSRFDTIAEIKTKYPDKRVVVATVRPTTEEALDAFRLGAVRYFAKSFHSHDLFNHVKDLVPVFTQASPA